MPITDRILELTTALVAEPSFEREAEVQEILARTLKDAGFDCRLTEVEPGRPNLIAQRGEGGIFFCSHADTHPPHAHPDPWRCRQRGELLVGRGVLDTKGQMAALVAAVESEPDAPVLIAITCDEERLGLGSEKLDVPDGPWREEGGIVLEPTDLEVCTAQSGHIDIAVEVSGTPAHVYAPEAGGSPIAAVLAAADVLETCSFLGARHPLLPAPAKRIGRLEGGEHLWRRPSRARIEITIDLVPGVSAEHARSEVATRLDDVTRRWGARGTSFLYEILDASDPTEVSADLPIVERLARALGSRVVPAGMPAWTDAGNLLVKHGLPCVVFGAGELGPAHSDDEWVRLGDLERLANVIRSLITSGGTAR
jgi:acetylornithine deacetylase/succinyl-diaminopimelate desuccinylase-like protein